MWKYTPNKKLLSWFRKNHRKFVSCRKYDDTVRQELALVGQDYEMWCAFRRFWEHTCFYSLKRLDKVPVNGLLFPLEFFDETEEN